MTQQTENIDIELMTTKNSPEEIIPSDWEIYPEDRADYIDWYPFYKFTPGHQIRVYYVNINKKSELYKRVLVLFLHGGAIPEFELDDDPFDKLIQRLFHYGNHKYNKV